MDDSTWLWLAAGVVGLLVLIIDLVLSFKRRQRRKARREAARRRQLVNQAMIWHGYPGGWDDTRPVPPISKVRLEYALGEEPIPPGLHAQHRLMGEELSRGRALRDKKDDGDVDAMRSVFGDG